MVILIVAVALLGWWAMHAWWWDVKFMGRLPPGSFGWPLLGESLAFLRRHSSSLKPTPFFEQRQARFGPLFKTHLFGEPVVISTNPSINKFIFQGEGVLFKSSYPTSFVKIIGKSGLMAIHGEMHAELRKKIMRVMGSTSLPHLVSDIDKSLLSQLSNWEQKPVIYLHKEASKISFDLVLKRLIGLSNKDEQFHSMVDALTGFFVALISVPINVPRTSYNKALKGRAKVVQLLESIIQQRKSSPLNLEHHPNDLLDAILEIQERDDKVFNHTMVIDVIIGLVYAAYETTATTITFLVMLLTKHENVLDKLMVEHMSIKREKAFNNKYLTWEDYKLMCYTKDVIFEALRLANIAPFVYRETLKDVEIAKYIIPKGWKVITSFSNVHMDPTIYKDPLDFNPSRWKNASNLTTSSFMPFGGGSRLCAGNDLAMLEISIFLHHFITKYKWTQMGKEQVTRIPGVIFNNGYPITVTKKTMND